MVRDRGTGNRRRRGALAAMVVVVSVVTFGSPARGQAVRGGGPPAAPPTIDGEPAADPGAEASTLGASRAAGLDEVHAQASAGLAGEALEMGSTRAIVSLAIDGLTPEAKLPAAEVAVQRATIAAAGDRVEALLEATGSTMRRRYETVPAVAVTATPAGLSALASSPDVDVVTPDLRGEAMLSTSTPHIGAAAVHAAGTGGAGQTIAVIDTGVNAGHPFLGGRVLHEACFRNLYGPQCPDGTAAQVGPGAAAASCDSLGCQHGTHVAGIAAGSNETMSGVAPQASIIAINIFSDDGEGGVTFDLSDALAALEHVHELAVTQDIAALNMSLGAPIQFEDQAACDGFLPPVTAALDQLRADGIVLVGSAGNEGNEWGVSYPACVSSVVAVGASAIPDQASGLNGGPLLDVHAPGLAIRSSVFETSLFPPDDPDYGADLYYANSGTSMAAPHVAGAVALMRERAPQRSVEEIVEAIKATGVPITDFRTGISRPRIQVDRAVRAVTPTDGCEERFSDVDAGHAFLADLCWATALDIVQGYDDGTLRPAAPMTRQAAAAFLHRSAGSPAGPFDVPGFTDVAPGHPFATEISWLRWAGLAEGYDDGSFQPTAPVSRQALVAFLHRLAGSPLGPFGGPAFDDVDADHRFAVEIAWARAARVANGDPAGSFGPDRTVSRQAALAFLHRNDVAPLQAPFSGCGGQTEVPVGECESLVALHAGTAGGDWVASAGWGRTASPCTWLGVQCGAGHVTGLLLTANGLSGPLPPELSGLPALELLLLSDNGLSGSVPTELAGLGALRIARMQNNALEGQLPSGLGDLTNLTQLLLDRNQLTGSIPDSFGGLSSIQYLWLHANALEGQIPSTVGGLVTLLDLRLSDNLLSGSIPPELGSLSTLVRLWLNGNQLTGIVPATIEELSALEELLLYGNGCLQAENGSVAAFLDGLDPAWAEGCV